VTNYHTENGNWKLIETAKNECETRKNNGLKIFTKSVWTSTEPLLRVTGSERLKWKRSQYKLENCYRGIVTKCSSFKSSLWKSDCTSPKICKLIKCRILKKILVRIKLRNSYWRLTNWARTWRLAILSDTLYNLLQTYADENEFAKGPSLILKF